MTTEVLDLHFSGFYGASDEEWDELTEQIEDFAPHVGAATECRRRVAPRWYGQYRPDEVAAAECSIFWKRHRYRSEGPDMDCRGPS